MRPAENLVELSGGTRISYPGRADRDRAVVAEGQGQELELRAEHGLGLAQVQVTRVDVKQRAEQVAVLWLVREERRELQPDVSESKGEARTTPSGFTSAGEATVPPSTIRPWKPARERTCRPGRFTLSLIL